MISQLQEALKQRAKEDLTRLQDFVKQTGRDSALDMVQLKRDLDMTLDLLIKVRMEES